MSATIDLSTLAPSPIQRLTACEPGDTEVTLFRRDAQGQLITETVPFQPFILGTDDDLFADLDGVVEIRELKGSNHFTCQAIFAGQNAHDAAVKELKLLTGFNPSSAGAPYKVTSDSVQQFLTSSQNRLFAGMTFAEVHRLQLDIEVRTTTGFSFPNAEREDDRVILIAMSDNQGWETVLSEHELGEKKMLQEMVKLINERNPDVIEGHNLFNFDLPYLEARAKRHRVPLKIGRDGNKIKARRSRFNVAERTIDYTRYECYGRHIIDTFHLTQLFDVTARELDSYGLKAVAKYFGVAAPQRTYVPGDQITRIYDENPEELTAYALDDVRETRAISALLSPSYFYQTQLTPISYQNCIVRGNATRIDSIFLARYLEAGHSLPTPSESQQYTGGLSESFHSGIFENVWHADVRSLYPSILMAEKLAPAADELGVFQEFLGQLRSFRLAAKDQMRQAENEEQREYFQALQSTFKILINSFYGYLGFGYGAFNDFDVAAKVTAKGREILTTMLNYLQQSGATVIEMDTDGLYFQPPADFTGTPEAMEANIQAQLPEGIEVELDQTYQTMFGYKAKNYALLHHDGRVSLTGAALKSRGLEPFQREFIQQLITELLHQRPTALPALYSELKQKIENRALPLSDFAKAETLKNSLKSYEQKMSTGKGRRSAAYELALGAEQEFRQGDQIRYFVTGTKKKASVVDNSRLYQPAQAEDDLALLNTSYYMGKLDELYAKFKDFAQEPAENLLF